MKFLGTIKLKEEYMYGNPMLGLVVEGKVCGLGPITGDQEELFNMYSFVGEEGLEEKSIEDLIYIVKKVLEIDILGFKSCDYKTACENIISEIESYPIRIFSVETIGGGPILIDSSKLLHQLKNYVLICC